MAIQALQSPRVRRRQQRLSALPAEPALDDGFARDYWVAHSDGFRVDASKGRLGFVEYTTPDPAHPGDVSLFVRVGILGLRVVVVRSADVAAIVPCAQRLWLHSGAELTSVLRPGIAPITASLA